MPREPHPGTPLVDDLRRVIERAVGTDPSGQEVARAREALARLEALLAGFPDRPPTPPADPEDAKDPAGFLPLSPVSGHLNPIAPPVSFRRGDGCVEGVATFGLPHEGPPGYVHGAVIAGVFDEVLAFALLGDGLVGMTKSLTTHYRRPTPLGVEIRFVGRTDRVDGKRLHAVGEAWAGEKMTARAEGVFVSPTPARAAEYWAERMEP